MSIAEHMVHETVVCLDDAPDALISLVRLKSHEEDSCTHSIAVCALMASLAKHMGLCERQRQQAALAGLLHDIGKALVAASLLAKPGRLTREEFAAVRAHPRLGVEALQATAGVDDAIRDAVHHHHERIDGRGYPDGLKGDRIALFSRMVAVCDVYDAITSNRPYKDGWDPAAAMRRMDEWAQVGQFDPAVLRVFREVVGEYPVGSLVRLRSGRLAVVNAQNPGSPSKPSVTAFYCARSHRALAPEVVDLHRARAEDSIVGVELNTVWRFSDLESLWAGDLGRRLLRARPHFTHELQPRRHAFAAAPAV